MLIVGDLRLKAMHTPGHTRDSMSLVMADRVFTGDALLIGGTGRTDLPTGDPHELYDSLFEGLLRLPPETLVFPAHDYKGRSHSTIGTEIAENPRLQKTERAEFVAMMQSLDLSAPTHLTEALRTNMSGGKTVANCWPRGRQGPLHVAGGSRIGSAATPHLVVLTSEGHSTPAGARARHLPAASWSCGSTANCPTRRCASSLLRVRQDLHAGGRRLRELGIRAVALTAA